MVVFFVKGGKPAHLRCYMYSCSRTRQRPGATVASAGAGRQTVCRCIRVRGALGFEGPVLPGGGAACDAGDGGGQRWGGGAEVAVSVGDEVGCEQHAAGVSAGGTATGLGGRGGGRQAARSAARGRVAGARCSDWLTAINRVGGEVRCWHRSGAAVSGGGG